MCLSTVLKNKSDKNFSSIIFDLGNVVLFFDHWIICHKLKDRFGVDSDKIFEKIFKSGLEKQFDEGKLSPEQFTHKCSKELGVPLELQEFKAIWIDIFKENPPVIELIKILKTRVKVLLLSNTNIWHLEHVEKQFKVLELFDDSILSFIVGYTKPHNKIFDQALELSGAPESPSKCIFIDDIETHVRAAVKLGVYGIHFKNFNALRQELKKIKII